MQGNTKQVIKLSGTAWAINVSGKPTDPEDRLSAPQGSYMVFADTEEEALDAFHSQIPIRCLDDFLIEAFEINSL